jgi:hypothetical protein
MLFRRLGEGLQNLFVDILIAVLSFSFFRLEVVVFLQHLYRYVGSIRQLLIGPTFVEVV